MATTIFAEFSEPLSGLYCCMPRESEGRFGGEVGAVYLSSGSNEVKVWGR